jgi:hypothetical protein
MSAEARRRAPVANLNPEGALAPAEVIQDHQLGA